MSNTVASLGVNVTVTSNIAALTAQVTALNAALAKHLTTMNDVKERSKFLGDMGQTFKTNAESSGLFTTQTVKMGTAVDHFSNKLQKQQLTMTQARRALKGLSSDVSDLANQQARMRASTVLSQGAGTFQVTTPRANDSSMGLDVANEKMRIHNSLISQINQKYINWGKNTQWAGRQLTVGFTVPLVIFGGLASKIFRDADKELTKLKKVYGEGIGKTTAEELDTIGREVLDLSMKISEARGGNLNEILATASDIAATGQTGEKLKQTLDQTTRFQTLGDIDRETSIKATLSLQTAFRLSNEELTNSINFLNAAENATSLSMEDMAEAIPRAGTVVKGLGGEVKDLALYMTAMREGGVSAAEGANALKSGLASIINPSTKAVKVLSGFGIDIEKIVETNKGELTPTILALQKELAGLDDLSRSKSIVALFGKYQFARMSALFNNLGAEGSQTNTVIELMAESVAKLGEAADIEEKRKTSSLSSRYERAVNSIKNALIPIGELFTKIAIPIIEGIAKILSGFNKLPDSIKLVVTGVMALIAVVGPLLMLMGQFGNMFGQVKNGAQVLRQTFSYLTGNKIAFQKYEAESPETMAHKAAMQSDSNALIDHATTVQAMSDALAKSFQTMQTTLGSRVDPNAQPSALGGNRLPTVTDKRVGKEDINQQYAMQLLANSQAGISGGLFSPNPTTNRDKGVIPRNWLYLEEANLRDTAAAIEAVDAAMAAELRNAAADLKYAKTGENFGAYSHSFTTDDGVSPLGSIIEHQQPNLERGKRTDRSRDLLPEELDPAFIGGYQLSAKLLHQGGGAGLYDEATKRPALMRQLKMNIAAGTAKTAEEFQALMTALSGESAEAVALARAEIVKLGDQWQARLKQQLFRAGVDPSAPLEFNGPGSTTPAAPPRPQPPQPINTTDPFRTRVVVGPQARPIVSDPKKGSLVERQGRVMAMNTLMTGEWTAKIKELISSGQAQRLRFDKLVTKTGEFMDVLTLLDKNGEALAFTIRDENGKRRAISQSGRTLVQGHEASLYIPHAAPSAVGSLRPQVDAAEMARMHQDALDEDRDRTAKRRRTIGPAAMPKIDTSGWTTIRVAAKDVEDSTKKTIDGTEATKRNIAGAASAMGVLVSTGLLFAGNSQSAAVQFAFMASTMATMAPMFAQIIPQSAKTQMAAAFAPLLSMLGGIKTRLLALMPALASLGPALLNPWTLAIAAVALLTVGLIKMRKDGLEKAIEKSQAYGKALTDAVKPGIELLRANENIIKRDKSVTENVRGWKEYSLRVGVAAAATKQFTEQVKENNADLIAGLEKLNGDDLKQKLTEIFQGMVIAGATEEQALMFLDSLGTLINQKPLTVEVVASLKGWSDGKTPEQLLEESVKTATLGGPDTLNLHDGFQKRVRDAQEGWLPSPNIPMLLEEEFNEAKPVFEAWGQNAGKVLGNAIETGLITPDNGKYAEYAMTIGKSIVDNINVESNADGLLEHLLEQEIHGPKVRALFEKAGVDISEGFNGLAMKLHSMKLPERQSIISDFLAMGGREAEGFANSLQLAGIGLDGVASAAVSANPDLQKNVAIAQEGAQGYSIWEGAIRATTKAVDNAATTGDQLNEMLKKQYQAFSKDFFDKAKENIKNYAATVRKRNQEMLEDLRRTERNKLEALRNSERDKLDAQKKAAEKRQKAAQDEIDRTSKRYDAEIDAIQKAEDARKKAFEAEKERIRRLTEQRNFNIDYAEAVANGDMFGAARIRNEQDAAKQSYSLDDREAAADSAYEKKIARIENERDAKIEAMEKALEKQKETDDAAAESAEKASEARINAAERASERTIDAAEKAAEQSNAAAEKHVEAMKKLQAQAETAVEQAIANGQNGLAEVLKWAEKLGIPAATATRMFKENALKWPGFVAGGLNAAATDPKVAAAARLVGITATASMLGIETSKSERSKLANTNINLGDYFALRMQGQSANSIFTGLALGVPLGGTETKNMPGRWTGGPVSRGMPYVVGENGHEIFVPESNGRILNQRQMRQAGREGGMGGSEGFGVAMGLGLASVAAKQAAKTLADSVRGVFSPSAPGSGASQYAGPVTQGNGIFDGGFSYPFGGKFRISSPFGYRNSPHGYGRTFHSGTDIAAPTGTPIKAIGGGTAQAVGWDPAKDPRGRPWLGQRIILNHGSGWQSYYGHMSEYRIREGQRVSEGQTIGMVGSTGASTGPHLHLTIKNGGKLVNPSMVIPGLMRGAKINYDNTLANLHRGETVLTAPITSKFEALANNMTRNATGGDSIKIVFTGPVNADVDVEAGVTAALNKRDARMGRSRKVN